MSGKHGRQRGANFDASVEGPRPQRDTAPSHARHRSAAARVDVAGDVTEPAVVDHGGRTATIELPPRPPEVSLDGIVPAGGRRAAREEQRVNNRKRALFVGAGLIVVALIVWAISAGTGKSAKTAPAAAAAGRTQTTLLVQVKDATGAAVDSALVAHDSATHSGAVVLVPSAVIGQVPGFGPMAFGQALLVGQPNAPRATLSDLMGVTIDGSWVLTTQGLQALVDKVGGVTIDVDVDVTRPGANGTTEIVVAAGHQKLAGANAVAFATYLGTNETEQLRLARFDAVFSAVLAQLPKQPAAVSQLLTGLGSASSSSMPAAKVAAVLVGLAADSAENSTSDTVLPVNKLETGDTTDAFSLDTTATAVLVKQQFADSVPANKLVSGNRVMIENQVGTPGIGETTRARLLHAGFTYLPGQNAPGMPNATAPSVVLISGTTSADIAKGNAVATALGLPTSDVRVSQEPVRVADIVVLLGADYKP